MVSNETLKIWEAWSILGIIYFLVLVAFGGFFIVNLALAVISDKFEKACDLDALEDEPYFAVLRRYVKRFLKLTKFGTKISDWLFQKKEPFSQDTPRKTSEKWKCCNAIHRAERWVHAKVKTAMKSEHTARISMLVILANTITLAMEFDGQDKIPGYTMALGM